MRLVRGLAIVLLAMTGCAKKPPVQITDAANGKSVEVRRGQSVELVLPSNSSTGYRWDFVVAPRALAAVGDPVYQSEAKLGRVGGGGTTTWHFTTSRAATDTLRLAYTRPWEANGPAAESFQCVVIVR
jgi:inhibitor of cysteine peptidase